MEIHYKDFHEIKEQFKETNILFVKKELKIKFKIINETILYKLHEINFLEIF